MKKSTMSQKKLATLLPGVLKELPERDRLYAEMWLEMHEDGTLMGQWALSRAQAIVDRAIEARYNGVFKMLGV